MLQNQVGLPDGVLGNSVGHMSIGAGRIILQDILRITTHSKWRDRNNNYIKKIKQIVNVFMVGVLSDGGVWTPRSFI